MAIAEPQLRLGAERITGTLERVLTYNPATGWAALLIIPGPRSEPIKVVGVLSSAPAAAMLVEASGTHEQHSRFGPQFRASSIALHPPPDAAGLERFLADALPGVGPSTASRLVRELGESATASLGDAAALANVPGIGKKKARAIADAWNARGAESDALIFLRGLGLGSGLSRRVLEHFKGKDVCALLRKNPYLLIRVPGIAFMIADRAAKAAGIAADSPFRIRAGLAHALTERAGEGHTAATRAELVSTSLQLLELPAEAIEAQIDAAVSDGLVATQPADDDTWFMLPYLKKAEEEVAADVSRLARDLRSRKAPTTAQIEKRFGFCPDDAQLGAIAMGLSRGLSIITGGPGTGKTSITRAIASLFQGNVQLAAPTGRAAQRLADATGRHAATIHRLLRAQGGPGGWHFRHDRQEPLALGGGLLIVDEASMLDAQLASALLSAVPDDGSLLLVGDANQLPSVGPGNVLADLIAAGVPTTRLLHIYRQAEDSPIPYAAHDVLAGRVPPLDAPDCRICAVGDDARAGDVLDVVEAHRTRGVAPGDIQVLAPMRKGPMGVDALNVALQRALNPAVTGAGVPTGKHLQVAGEKRPEILYPGDRIIQNSNNYNRQLFNGDLLTVQSVSPHASRERWIEAISDGVDGPRRLRLEGSELADLSLAWCLTCHKSQGGQYPHVIIALVSGHYVMLARRLLYTAMTRAQKSLTIVGSKKAVAMAAHNLSAPPQRRTLLTRLLVHAGRGDAATPLDEERSEDVPW